MKHAKIGGSGGRFSLTVAHRGPSGVSATVDFTALVFAELMALEKGVEPGVHPLEDLQRIYIGITVDT